MATTPSRPDSNHEVLDDETRRILDERLKTIDRDERESEEWTPALKDERIRQLKQPVPR